MALGRLSVVLDANIAKFESDLGRAQRTADRQARAIQRSFEDSAKRIGTALAGAFAATKLVEMVKGAIDLGDTLHDMSQKVGMSASALSVLKVSADTSGASLDVLNTGMNAFARSVGAAAYSATSQQAAAFKALGISITDAAGRTRPMQDLFQQATGKLAGYRDGVAKTVIVQQLFGKSGADLIPMLNDLGTNGFAAATENAKALGAYISDDAAAAAGKFNDQVDALKTALGGLAMTAAQELLPALQATVDKLVDFIKTAREDGTIKRFADAIGFIVGHLKEIAEFVIARAVLARLAAGFMAVRTAALAAGTAMAALNAAAYGIGTVLGGGVVALVAALAVGLYNYRDQVNPAKQSTDELRKAIEELQIADKNAVGPATAHAQAVLKVAQANLVAANAELTRLQQVQEASDRARQKYGDATITTGPRPDFVIGPDGKYAPGGYTSDKNMRERVAAQRKMIADLQKQVDSAGKALDTRGLFAGLGDGADAPTLVQTKAAAKVKAQAAVTQGLVDQVAKLSMATNAYELYQLAQKGATADELDYAKTLQGTRDALQARADKEAELKQFLQQHEAEIRGVTQSELEFIKLSEMATAALNEHAVSQDAFNRIIGEGVKKLNDQVHGASDEMSQYAIQAARNMQSAFADFLFDPFKGGLKGMLESFGDILRKMYAQLLASQVFDALGQWGKNNANRGGFWGSIAQAFAGAFTKQANGGVWQHGVQMFAAGGIVGGPTLFPMARGMGLMGEAGPEAVMPLTRGSNGKLGVMAHGGGAMQVQVNITNKGDPVQARQTGMRQDGNKMIIDMVLDAVSGDIASGGKTAKALQGRYGLQRRGVPVGA